MNDNRNSNSNREEILTKEKFIVDIVNKYFANLLKFIFIQIFLFLFFLFILIAFYYNRKSK